MSTTTAQGLTIRKPRFLKMVDCLLLLAVVLVSALPYMSGTGFHSDDWSYQAELSQSSGESLGKIFLQMWAEDSNIRPVMVAYLVLTFRAFGHHQMAYQVFNTFSLGLAVVILYLVLRELRTERFLALSIALVFGLLPHYSTDRFWWASHQAVFCMTFAFLGILALSRSFRQEESHPKMWLAVAVLSLLASVLSYEVALGLIVASVAMIGWREFGRNRDWRRHGSAKLIGLAIPILVLLSVGIFKALTQNRIVAHNRVPFFLTHFVELTWLTVNQAIQFCFFSYGLKMPGVLMSLYRQSALDWAALSVSAIVTFLVAAYLWKHMDASAIPNLLESLRIFGIGVVLFCLGYALFFRDPGTEFSSVGINSRVTIASAFGAAFVSIAMVSLVCSCFRSGVVRVRFFSLAIGLICGANCMAVNGIAYFWRDAALKQEVILNSVATNVHALPHGSVLLLDGFCRFSGPGVVFETDWDTTGAVQFTLNDYSLSSDVVSPNTHFLDPDVETTIYGTPEHKYPYSDHLYVYNVGNRLLAKLPSKAAAYSYLSAFNPGGDSGCPPGREGDGTRVF